MLHLRFICLVWAFLLTSGGSGEGTERSGPAVAGKQNTLQDERQKEAITDPLVIQAWTGVPVQVKFEVHDDITYGSIVIYAGDGSSAVVMGSSCRDLRLVEGTSEKQPSIKKSVEGYVEELEQLNILQQVHSYDYSLESQITEDEMEADVAEVMEHENENSESVAIGLDVTEDMKTSTLNWISPSSSASNAFGIHSTSATPSVTSSHSHSSLSPSEDDSGIHSTSAYSNIDEIDLTLKPSLTPRGNLDSQPPRYSFKCEDLPSTVVYELEYTYTDPGRFAMILQFQDPVTDEVIWKLERRVLVMELLQVELDLKKTRRD